MKQIFSNSAILAFFNRKVVKEFPELAKRIYYMEQEDPITLIKKYRGYSEVKKDDKYINKLPILGYKRSAFKRDENLGQRNTVQVNTSTLDLEGMSEDFKQFFRPLKKENITLVQNGESIKFITSSSVISNTWDFLSDAGTITNISKNEQGEIIIAFILNPSFIGEGYITLHRKGILVGRIKFISNYNNVLETVELEIFSNYTNLTAATTQMEYKFYLLGSDLDVIQQYEQAYISRLFLSNIEEFKISGEQLGLGNSLDIAYTVDWNDLEEFNINTDGTQYTMISGSAIIRGMLLFSDGDISYLINQINTRIIQLENDFLLDFINVKG